MSTSAQDYAEAGPHQHFAVIRRLERVFSGALPHGALAEFESTLADPNSEGVWYLRLANGGVHQLRAVGGSGFGGGGVLGTTADTIVWGPAPDPVPVPDVAADASGRVKTADVEAWVAAVVTNGAEVRDEPDPQHPGQTRRVSWLSSVERESLRGDYSGRSHKVGVYLKHHSQGGTYILWEYVTPRGQQKRGEPYGDRPDAI